MWLKKSLCSWYTGNKVVFSLFHFLCFNYWFQKMVVANRNILECKYVVENKSAIEMTSFMLKQFTLIYRKEGEFVYKYY